MDKIVDGIRKFQSDEFQQEKEFFEKLAEGQSPDCLFITCSDSRIDPNRLTQTKPGELFVLRTAGNIVPPYGSVVGGESATIEYAVAALKIKNIVVCGHSHCGAMSGLLTPENLHTLPAVRQYLEHAAATRQIIEENFSEITDFGMKLSQTVETNVLVQIENLKTHPTVAAAVLRNELNLHGWVYHFESGQVTTYDKETNKFRSL